MTCTFQKLSYVQTITLQVAVRFRKSELKSLLNVQALHTLHTQPQPWEYLKSQVSPSLAIPLPNPQLAGPIPTLALAARL